MPKKNKHFSKEFLDQRKIDLEKEKEQIEGQIKEFRQFPSFGTAEDENIQEVEGYEQQLGMEKSLLILKKQINIALKKLEKGTYGICEQCELPIEEGRLEAYSEAALCVTCGQKRKK